MISHLFSQLVVVLVVSAVGLILHKTVRVSRLLPWPEVEESIGALKPLFYPPSTGLEVLT